MTRAIRFQPDPLDHALIDFKNESKFSPEAVALILNESYSGCALVFKAGHKINQNQNIKVQVGRMDVMAAQVIWIKELEEGLLKVGIKFLE